MSRSLIVGVIGHVDHGKTALVRALTGADTDRLKEEKARGVSIVPGFALLKVGQADDREIDLVDLPGHERFVRAMVSGATGMRAVLLAVDANEGIKPQTIEHLEIARLIGVRRGVVALTKSDLVDETTLRARAQEVGASVARAGITDPAIVATSAHAGTGIAELKAALAALLDEAPAAGDDGFPYLPIDRVFARPGFGAIVTGTLRRGRLSVGDRLVVMPGGQETSVRGIEIHGRAVSSAEPGRRTAIALRGVERGALERGQALVPPAVLTEASWIDIAVTAVASADDALASGTVCRLLFGTAEVSARLRLLDRDALELGASALAQLRTEEPIAVPAREPFILRLDSPSRTVAGGHVLDPTSQRRKRHDERIRADLTVAAAGRPKETLNARLARRGANGAGLPELARLVGIAPDRVRRGLAELGAREVGDVYLGAQAFAALRDKALAALAAHHRDHPVEHGMPLDRLAKSLAVADPIAGAVLRDLVATREAVQAGTLFRRAEFDPARNETEQVRAIEAVYRKGGLSPPDETETVGRDVRRREALTYLLASGTLIRALDRVQKRTILFHRDAIGQAKTTLIAGFPGASSAESGFLAKEAGAALGISRKFSIPLLEHLDAIRFTRRIGDRRVFVQAD